MPVLTGDFSQVYQGIIGALTGDSTLAGMLGAVDAVYQGWPDLPPPLPALIVTIGNTRAVVQLDSQGLWWPTLQIDIVGVDPVIQRGIEARMMNLLDIPRTNPDSISMQDFEITQLFNLDSQEAGSIRWQNTDQQVKVLATLWRMRVQHK